MKLIVGLGNLGRRYEKTRHNVGFMVAGALARKFTIYNLQFTIDKKSKSEVLKIKTHGQNLVLAKPQTFMNEAGLVVKKLADFYHLEPAQIWIVHDDLDLPLGKIKIRVGGGTAGHHGLESIVQELGTADFVRFRLGIGKPVGHGEWLKDGAKRKGIESYVLSEFHSGEQGKAREMIKKAVKAIEVALEDGLEKAMNRFSS